MGMRKCSQCGRSGHNSRTCRIRVLGMTDHQSMKLFGVELELMSNNSNSNNTNHHHHHGFSFSSHSQLLSHHHHHHHKPTTTNAAAYLSLQPPRKKGVAWSEEEHKQFLVGLEQLGRGDWRGISRNFVRSRTSTQVASHAQKYFLRQNKYPNNNNSHTSTIHLPMMVRKEAQVQEDDESSTSVAIFPKLVASTADYYCTHTKRQPIAPVPEIPDCRLFSNLATQNAPSLELSLASPLQPPVSVCKI